MYCNKAQQLQKPCVYGENRHIGGNGQTNRIQKVPVTVITNICHNKILHNVFESANNNLNRKYS